MLIKPQRGILTSAQGNALGKGFVPRQALKGRLNFSYTLVRPYRAFLPVVLIPRALPWAEAGPPLRGC